MRKYGSMSSNVSIVICHPCSTFARTFFVFTCNCNYKVSFFCTSSFFYNFVWNTTQMVICYMPKFHVNLTIMYARETFLYKILL